jgi:subtilase family serine protease
LAFQDNANNETSFVIYINGAAWDKIGPNVTTFWIGVDCGASSSVYVTAQNPSGESGHSNTVRVDGGACAAPPPAVPNAPSNLRATGAREGQKFQLAFQDNANNETSFVIYINGAAWDKIGPNVTTFWIGVDCGASSSVYVTAQNPSGESGHSNTVRVDGTVCD